MKRSIWLDLFLFASCIALGVIGYLFLLSLLHNIRGGNAVAAAFLAAICLGANFAFFKAEGRSARELGLNAPKRRLGQFGIGFLAGALLVLVWAIGILLVGSANWQWHGSANLTGAGVLAAFYLFNNAGEELAYRGYAFLRLEESYGRTMAVMATSVAFALMHFQGGMSLWQALLGVLTNGMLFAALFSRFKSLPLVLGFHVAMNIFQDVYGLRQTALSLAKFQQVNTSGARGAVLLLLVGCLNLALCLVLLWPFRFSRNPREQGVN